VATQYSTQVEEGMDVYDAKKDKIGTVAEVLDAAASSTSRSGGGYLRVPTGFLGLGREHHIPFSAIRSVDGDRIHLDVVKDELDTRGYNQGPTAMDGDADYVSGETSRATTTTTTTPTAAIETDATRRERTDDLPRRFQLREEELIARKRKVETGEVRLGTEVVSEQRTLEVPVTREEVTIERRAVDRRPSDRPIDEREQVIEVPVTEEEVTLEKRAVVYEEVEVGKREVQETEQVAGTVRREELRLEREGEVDVQGAGTHRTNPDRA
jgi:uncharacterized protein (TIGR02271 family)